MTQNFFTKEQTIGENNLSTPHVCVTFGEIQEHNTQSTSKNFFHFTKSLFCGWDTLKWKRSKPSTLDLKGNHHKTQGKEIRDKQERLKQEKLNQIWERDYDKTWRKTIKKKAHKKDSEILTKLLTMKLCFPYRNC